MTRLEHVQVEAMDPRRFESVISPARYSELLTLIQSAARRLRGRVIWNVNSTAKGGGVGELLRPLLGYSRGGGVDARWMVISGDNDFFIITKRLHNHLHGIDGDDGPLGVIEHTSYEKTLATTQSSWPGSYGLETWAAGGPDLLLGPTEGPAGSAVGIC